MGSTRCRLGSARTANGTRGERIRTPGSSIRGEHPSRRGNKILKRALFLSALAATAQAVSRAYYDRKLAQGKRHNQVLIALARRRCDVLYAMLRDGTLYQTDHPRAA